jgi:hypothetical protein
MLWRLSGRHGHGPAPGHGTAQAARLGARGALGFTMAAAQANCGPHQKEHVELAVSRKNRSGRNIEIERREAARERADQQVVCSVRGTPMEGTPMEGTPYVSAGSYLCISISGNGGSSSRCSAARLLGRWRRGLPGEDGTNILVQRASA